jgi:hypothetical protein
LSLLVETLAGFMFLQFFSFENKHKLQNIFYFRVKWTAFKIN